MYVVWPSIGEPVVLGWRVGDCFGSLFIDPDAQHGSRAYSQLDAVLDHLAFNDGCPAGWRIVSEAQLEALCLAAEGQIPCPMMRS